MSDTTKKAIYEVLAGDGTLTALLGEDENGDPAIFNASMNKLENPPFPCIAFRESSGTAEGNIRTMTVDTEIFDIEIWARTESVLTVPSIHNEVDRLLHNVTLSLESGENYDCVRLSQTPDMYDDKLNLHFGLYRYQLVVSR